MLSIFKRPSKAEKLRAQYQKLMAQAHQLSKTDRTAADRAFAQTEAVMDELAALKTE